MAIGYLRGINECSFHFIKSNTMNTEKICKNCKHLFISGMFQDWGGTAGYCLLIQNDEKNATYTENGTREASVKAIVQLEHTCEKFERKH